MHCESHQFEAAVDLCGMCGVTACAVCIAYPKGPTAPGLCLGCARVQAGVSTKKAVIPVLDRKTLTRLRRAHRKAVRKANGSLVPPTLLSVHLGVEPVPPDRRLSRRLSSDSGFTAFDGDSLTGDSG